MKLLLRVVLALYILILMWLVLLKFSLDIFYIFNEQIRVVNLIPFIYSADDSMRHYITGIVVNFIAFIPLGLLLSANRKQTSWGRNLATLAAFSLTVELIQFVLAIGITDITDVITNTGGGLVGLKLYQLSSKYIDHSRLDRLIVLVGAVLMTVLILVRLFSFHIRYQSTPSLNHTITAPHEQKGLSLP